ncbi:hypothetical protein EB796_006476 [Bugula neritina]|uniref:Uncharacterized protein n=1 Tax=Bugula neritina TaxID=10212 RepID=A0A7J7K9A1_BUGNE|nr:hypothetical protein EB796_006476 [Bugula neritina]
MSKGHHGWQPQPTIIGVVDPDGPFIAPSPNLEVAEHDCVNISTPKPSIKGVTTPVEKRLSSRPSTPAQQLSGSFRAQSATLNRPRVASTRPVRSAGVRPQTTEVTQITTPVPFALQENIANNEDTQISQLASWSPSKPSPRIFQSPGKVEMSEVEEELDRPPTL